MKETLLARLKRRTQALARRIHQFYRVHPWQVIMLTILLAVVGAQTGLTWSQYRSNATEKNRVTSLPRAQLSDLNRALGKGEVKTVIRHTLSTGTVLQPETRNFLEVVRKDGRRTVIEESAAASAEIWKGLVARAFDSPVGLSTGYQADRDDRLAGMLRLLAIFVFIILVMVFAQMMMTEVLSGKSFKVQRPNRDIMLDDVIGNEEVKASLREVIDQLEHAKAYARQHIAAPRGILFTGDPGVGKTMLAKALANEINADFFAATGADFAEMYVGVGPKRVRSLFKQARMSKLAVIFIDEIDAIGSRNEMGQDSERRSTINAMLAELDGMESNGQLLIIGATNHLERLDPALRRPGRFDRNVHIPLPALKARKDIMAKYLGGVQLDSDVDLDAMALRTQGYSGAQLANVAAEAKNLALREKGGRGQPFTVRQEHLHHAQEVALLGESGRTAVGEELVRVTVHELGHALAGHLRCQKAYVEKVTVMGRGGALGYTLSRPLEENLLVNEEELRSQLVMTLGGRAAESVLLKTVSNGAVDDLKRASLLARSMVLELGMGRRSGLMAQIRPDEPIRSEQAEDIREILGEAYAEAQGLIRENLTWFTNKVQVLVAEGMLAHDALFSDLEKPSAHPSSPDAALLRPVSCEPCQKKVAGQETRSPPAVGQ